jgi:hypothetical protein
MIQDPTTQTFEGLLVRSFRLSGRRYRESFRLAVIGIPVEEQLYQGDILIAEYELGVQPKLGPIALYSRDIQSSLEPADAYKEHFSGNRDALDVRARPIEVDVSSAVAMPDEDFWHLIDLLGGECGARAVTRLRTALARRAPEAIGGFEATLSLKLHSLDHPRNTMSVKVGGRRVVSSDASLYLRCRIVAAGRSAYELALKPSSNSQLKGSSGENLLSVAASAYELKVGYPVNFVGLVPVETGDNRGHRGNVLPALPVRQEPMSRARYIASLQRNIDLFPHDPDDVWSSAEHWRSWYGIRYMVGTPGAYTEHLVLFGADLELPEEGADRGLRSSGEARAFLLDQLQLHGESLAGPADFVRGAIGRPGSELFSISRTSPLAVEEYLSRFGYPVLHRAN